MFIFSFLRVIILSVIYVSNKEKRKNLKKIERQSTGENDEIMRMIKVFAVVILALALFYFIFAIYNGEISFGKKEEENEPVEIQNIEILAGSTFNRVDSQYYVLFYDFEGNYSSKGVALYNLYMQKEDHLKMYVVDLGNKFNIKNLAVSKEEVNVSSAETLKVMDISLIKVNNGKAEVVVSGIDEIIEYQDNLLKS